MIFIYDYRDKHIGIEYENLKENKIQHNLAWKLLKYAVNHYTNYDFEKLVVNRTSKSKPYFENSTLKFNISHCKGIVVCIISDNNEVGIDIEKIDREVNVCVLNRCFDETEINVIKRNIDKEQYSIDFYRYWTLKECFVKTTGNGLSQGLINCVFYESDRDCWSIQSTDTIDSNKYIFKSMLCVNDNNIRDYIISACCENVNCIDNDIFTTKVIYNI